MIRIICFVLLGACIGNHAADPQVVMHHVSGHLDPIVSGSVNRQIAFARPEHGPELPIPLQISVFGYEDGRARIRVVFSSEAMSQKFHAVNPDLVYDWSAGIFDHQRWIETTSGSRRVWRVLSKRYNVNAKWREKVTRFLKDCRV